MKQANFYPGPSRVYSHIAEYIYEAYMDGIMSINHRSQPFMELMADTKSVLREKLLIPENYEIVFVSSATECWEIIAQSLTRRRSQHFFNGSFGEKWADYAANLVDVSRIHFGLNEVLPTGEIDGQADVLCVTQNETSNATQVGTESLRMLRSENPDKLIAVDATSSIGGIQLDFESGDVWYGSVQKCLGLPAGMGIMILSPMACDVAESIGENKHYNSILRLLENARKNQTSYTPNVLGIYLLNKTQKSSKGIAYTEQKLKERFTAYVDIFEKHDQVRMLVDNPDVRSTTVLALKTDDPLAIRTQAEEYNIILGNGYGPWKPTTFRIANFPAIKTKEIEKLTAFFQPRD